MHFKHQDVYPSGHYSKTLSGKLTSSVLQIEYLVLAKKTATPTLKMGFVECLVMQMTVRVRSSMDRVEKCDVGLVLQYFIQCYLPNTD